MVSFKRTACTVLSVAVLSLGATMLTGGAAPVAGSIACGEAIHQTMLTTPLEYAELLDAAPPSTDFIYQDLSDDEYGGLYWDAEGVLHVLFLNEADAAVYADKNLCAHVCDYSRDELRAVRDTVLREYVDLLGPASSSLDIRNNVVLIYPMESVTRARIDEAVSTTALKDYPVRFICNGEEGYRFSSNYKTLEDRYDAPPSDVQRNAAATIESQAALPSQYELWLANCLDNPSQTKRFSLGFFAMDNGPGYRYGFVTAGHAAGIGDTIYADEYPITNAGQCTKSIYNGPNVTDYAFVAMPKTLDGANKFYKVTMDPYDYYTSNGGYYSEEIFELGMAYQMAGNGYDYVLHSGLCIDDEYKLNSFSKACGLFSFNVYEGNSGGTIFSVPGLTSTGWYQTAGMVFGQTNDGYAMGYTVSQVCDALDLTFVFGSACKGDVNDDGEITVSDVRKALRASVGEETLTGIAYMRADLNCDSEITVSDVRALQRVVLGKDPWGSD